MSDHIRTVIDAKEYTKLQQQLAATQAELERVRGLLTDYHFIEDDGGEFCIECGQYRHVCGKSVECKLSDEIASWTANALNSGETECQPK